MRSFRIFASLVGFPMMLAATAAHAGCYKYYALADQQCNGADGCEGSYPVEICYFGCTSGTCEEDVNSGLCCGHQYFLPQIYPEHLL